MPKNLQGRNFLKLLDFTSDEIRYLLDLSKEFKRLKLTRTPHRYLEGRDIVLLFEKTSTRTRCSFEVAGRDLGMGVTYLDPGSSQMGKKESIEDTARVLGRMYDGIEYRGFAQSIVEEIANNAGVPVWNGLTTDFHPTQMLADALTIEENFGHLKGLKVVFMGDAGNNVGNSLMVICAKMGMNFVACGPKEQMPKAELVEQCREIAKENGCTITLTEDVKEGTANADVIYTDIWVSMGEDESLYKPRVELLSPFKVTKELMSKTHNDNTLFMHCLPSYHDFETETARVKHEQGLDVREVDDEVFRSKNSVVFDEAENRLHTIKAVMVATLGKED